MLCDNVNHSKSQTRPKSIGSLAKWSRSAACGLVGRLVQLVSMFMKLNGRNPKKPGNTFTVPRTVICNDSELLKMFLKRK